MAGEGEAGDASIDRLYALPLEEFTAARDDLARRLRQEGAPAAVGEVKQLRKPSVAAWALNQVRRNNRERSDELLVAGRRLVEAQQRLVAGEGREPFKEAAEDERRLVAELARDAERELIAVGRSLSAALQEKLRATLRAFASEAEARDAFALGRLVRDHEPTGLGPFPLGSGAPLASGERATETSETERSARERKARRVEERLERARARRRDLEEENAEAGRELREAQREAERLAGEVERAVAVEADTRRRRDEAAKEVRKLEGELRGLASDANQ